MARWANLLILLVSLAGCRKGDETRPFRLGYFPNLTHAQALIGDQERLFQKALGQPLETKRFNAGPSAMEALFAGELDMTYVGSGPAINAYVRSKGALRIISGAAAGGAVFVVKSAQGPGDLKGKRVATPQLGNTQDIALRHWLLAQGLRPSDAGGGDVTVVPIANSDILNLFKRGEIEGAWVPEPWGARLLAEGGGHILVDERTLWPDGKFPTTVVVASRQALEKRRPQVKALLRAHALITERAHADELRFGAQANRAFGLATGYPLPANVLKDALSRISFTTDPMPSQLAVAAKHAAELGYLPNANVEGLVDDSLLQEIAAERK